MATRTTRIIHWRQYCQEQNEGLPHEAVEYRFTGRVFCRQVERPEARYRWTRDMVNLPDWPDEE